MQSAPGPSFVCIGCRAHSPAVESEYTLISSRFGWRLTRRTNKQGELTLEWRCPKCWARYKEERALAMTPTEGMPAAPEDLRASSRDVTRVRPKKP